MRDEVTLDNGLPLKNSRITILTVFRKSFLHELHEENAGITKCQLMHPLTWHQQINRRLQKVVPYIHQVVMYFTHGTSDNPLSSPRFVTEGWYIFHRLGWQKVATHCRLFLYIPLPISNVFYHCKCCHLPPDRAIFPEMNFPESLHIQWTTL